MGARRYQTPKFTGEKGNVKERKVIITKTHMNGRTDGIGHYTIEDDWFLVLGLDIGFPDDKG